MSSLDIHPQARKQGEFPHDGRSAERFLSSQFGFARCDISCPAAGTEALEAQAVRANIA